METMPAPERAGSPADAPSRVLARIAAWRAPILVLYAVLVPLAAFRAARIPADLPRYALGAAALRVGRSVRACEPRPGRCSDARGADGAARQCVLGRGRHPPRAPWRDARSDQPARNRDFVLLQAGPGRADLPGGGRRSRR